MKKENNIEQQENSTVNVEFNLAQLIFITATQQIKICEWGRGTGKSTVLGANIRDCVLQLPRSTGVLVSATYAALKTRTLPSTIAGLELLGFHKDIHFFVGKRAPASWNWLEPYEPPLDYTNAIHFYNGTVMLFVSQDASASSGRGLNVDWVCADEAALLDEDKFNTDVLLTNRGNLKRVARYPDDSWSFFEECDRHHSVTLLTSTPVTARGRWILKYEELAMMNPEKFVFLRASAEINRKNLGADYFENARASMPDFLYKAEVENIRINQIEDGFYPMLDEDKHTYISFDNNYYQGLSTDVEPNSLGDSDCDPAAPLIGGIDWGANINCMLTCQQKDDTLYFLKNIYVKFPKVIDDMILSFVKYYEHHHNKLLYLWYDPSGNNKTANSRLTYAQQVKEQLEANGWRVQLMTRSNVNVEHSIKYKLIVNILRGDMEKYPKVKINKSNCKELYISMLNAPAKQGKNDSIRKDKSSERKKGFAQEHATHFSDTFDVIIVGMFLNLLYKSSGIQEVQIRSSRT